MTELKNFAEWLQASQFDLLQTVDPRYYNRATGMYYSPAKVVEIYESETRKYSVGEVWDSLPKSSGFCSWNGHNHDIRNFFTRFAEKYYKLKKEGRIK